MVEILEDDNDLCIHPPEFLCEKPLGKVPPPLPCNNHFAAFIGPPGSGKTSLAISLLVQTSPKLYHCVFDRVFIFMPKNSIESLADSPFKNHRRVYHEFTQETLANVVEEAKTLSSQKKTSLMIIDDFMVELKNTELRKDLERVAGNRRHLRLSTWILTQTYRSIPLTTRKLITHVFFFRPQNIKELISLREELLPIDKATFEAFYQHTFDDEEPHTFMLIDVTTGAIYKNFKRLSTIKMHSSL